MLCCQQKNAHNFFVVMVLVCGIHCCAVWFFCIRNPIRHGTISSKDRPFLLPIRLQLRTAPVSLSKVSSSHLSAMQKKEGNNTALKVKEVVKKKMNPKNKVQEQPQKKKNIIKPNDVSNKKDSFASPKKDEKKIQKVVPLKKEILKKEVVKDTLAPIESVEKAIEIVPLTQISAHTLSSHVSIEKQEHQVELLFGLKDTVDTLVDATIHAAWRPPTGIPAGTACRVLFSVDTKGKAHDIVVEKSSGMLMFDISVKAMLVSTTFPLPCSGNTFSFVFMI